MKLPWICLLPADSILPRQKGSGRPLPQLHWPTAAGHSHAGHHPWALVARAVPTDLPYSHLSQGDGDEMAEHLSPGSSAELAQEMPARKDAGGLRQLLPKHRRRSNIPPPAPPSSTYIWRQPWSGTLVSPAPAKGRWGGWCLTDSPLVHRAWEQPPPWEQTTTLVSTRVAETKEGAQAPSPSPFTDPVPALILPLLT